ncbi:hypothetical protein BLNAU_6620 [Blattamonas nauphoetae]|uniref:Uncharacterized protein n=1 Tax=Blattamonas nauphoetae TaxID=2049346 RepID=A0ABQ9Y3N5_9EUKA|nr:hypothetical protein BLNAU_6620 [Blattamonas nauphoetae]
MRFPVYGSFIAGIVSLGVLGIFHRLLMISLRGNVLFEYLLAPKRNNSTSISSLLTHSLSVTTPKGRGEPSLAAIINHMQETLRKAVEKRRMNEEMFSHSLRHIETILASFFPPLTTFDEAITSSLCQYSTLSRFIVDYSSQTALGEV